MMKQRAPKRPADERRRMILEGAQAAFATQGYANTGTEDIARAAGVAPSAIYRHFAGKRDLYLETLRAATQKLLRLWSQAAGSEESPLEEIRALGLGYYDHVAGRSPYARLWFQALAEADDDEVREAIAANFRGMVGAIEERIREGQASGDVRAELDPRVAAWHFMAIGLAFDLVHHLEMDDELDRRKVEEWGDLYLDSLRGGGHD